MTSPSSDEQDISGDFAILLPSLAQPRIHGVFRVAADTEAFNTIAKRRAVILEFEDQCYHLNSAVTLPVFIGSDDREADLQAGLLVTRKASNQLGDWQPELWNTLRRGEVEAATTEPRRHTVVLLATVLRFLADQPEMRAVVVGHTDTSGTADVNDPLSKARADNVFFLLSGDRDRWVSAVMERSVVLDRQTFLAHYARHRGWPTDPGPLDDMNGPQTEAATRHLQESYNQQFEAEIAVDGVFGRQTWGACFDIYMADLAAVMEIDADALDHHRTHLRWADDAEPALGLGENRPIAEPERDGYRSIENRRVEVLFYLEDDLPELHPGALYAYELRRLLPQQWIHAPAPQAGGDFTLTKHELSEDDERELVPRPAASLDADDPWAFLDPLDEHDPRLGMYHGKRLDEQP